ncbi:piRNA biogenesis protein EXD1 [Cololabis saira]|uniref:piRNA biogenesis protein EXD1 n=1 Tax=Cololabis saira TaxID=129043 RepID=UPI002AD3E02E|nr:piRNA biogenesis protein EXD1 [Cololabis saira]
MDVEDVEFLNILKGKRIKLSLKTSSYFGVVHRINPNKTLVLADVTDRNGSKIPGTKLFCGHEIVNVEFVKESNDDNDGNINVDGLGEQLKVEKFQPYRKTITLDDDDNEEYINFVVIDEFHEKFGPAVMHIKKQQVIGVGAEGVETFKSGRLCWLQIATKQKVYLFDVLQLGTRAFKNGLSMILESKHILKVIHDCRAIAGSLISQFGVKMTNVFDTQVHVADVMCFYSETGGFLPDKVCTLQEVVSLHLKVPSSKLTSLQMKSQITEKEREIWFNRPCPVALLKVLVLSVIHLQPLRLVLLDSLMMDYMAVVDSYLSSTHYEPAALEPLTMEDLMELPRELQQLSEMQRERRERAAGRFPVTEQGLLARFNPHPQQQPPQISPAENHHTSTETESFEPAVVKPPSSTEMEPLGNQNTPIPLSVTRVSPVDDCASLNQPSQLPTPAIGSDVIKEMTASHPLSTDVARGCKEAPVMGRGKPFGKEQASFPALPSIGRGFFLQLPPPQIPGESARNVSAPDGLGAVPTCGRKTPRNTSLP